MTSPPYAGPRSHTCAPTWRWSPTSTHTARRSPHLTSPAPGAKCGVSRRARGLLGPCDRARVAPDSCLPRAPGRPRHRPARRAVGPVRADTAGRCPGDPTPDALSAVKPRGRSIPRPATVPPDRERMAPRSALVRTTPPIQADNPHPKVPHGPVSESPPMPTAVCRIADRPSHRHLTHRRARVTMPGLRIRASWECSSESRQGGFSIGAVERVCCFTVS
jgi:hypothetical protein